MQPLTSRTIKINDKKGKFLVTRHYMNHGHEFINYRPINAPTNHPVEKVRLDTISITVLK